MRARELRGSFFGLSTVRTTAFSNVDGVWYGGIASPTSRLHGASASGSAAAPVSGAGRARAHGARQHDAAPEQGAAVEQAVAGHLLDRLMTAPLHRMFTPSAENRPAPLRGERGTVETRLARSIPPGNSASVKRSRRRPPAEPRVPFGTAR